MALWTRRRRASAFAAAWMLFGTILFICAAMVAVDYARIAVAKTELHNAVDAAVRAGVAAVALGPTDVQNEAVAMAARNTCDGLPVVLDPNNDIEFGIYDTITKEFRPLTGSNRASATAVRVTAWRSAARGNAIPLSFAPFLGFSSKDLSASATATITSVHAIYIGLGLTRMFNTTHFDAYNSAEGPYSASNAMPGKLYGNTNLLLAGSASVNGEAHWGPQGTLTKSGTPSVGPGPLSQSATALTFPPVVLGNMANVNDNAKLSSTYYKSNVITVASNKGTLVAPAGTYYCTSLTVGAGSTLLFTPPTTIYVDGAVKIQGTLAPTTYKPSGLGLQVTANGHVSIDPGTFYGLMYAPEADVHHHNGGSSYGGVISNLLCFRQTGGGHADNSLDYGNGKGGVISVVK